MYANPSIDAREGATDDPFGQIHVRGKIGDDEQSEADTFKSVLFYCVLILGGPIVAFAVTKVFVLGVVLQWDTDTIRANVVSAVVAVVILHVALGLFISKAYFGSDVKKKIGKKD